MRSPLGAAAIVVLREVLNEDDPAVIDEPISIGELRVRLDAGARLRFGARYTELSRCCPSCCGTSIPTRRRPRAGSGRENC